MLPLCRLPAVVSSSTPGRSSIRPTQGAFPGRRIPSVTSFPAVQFNKAYPSRHAHSLRTQLRAARDKPYSLGSTNMPLTPSDIAAVASAVTAVVALFVALLSAHVQRAHNRRSVTPHLDFVYGITDTGPLALSLVSNGIGPAKLLDFSVTVDRKRARSLHSLNVWHNAFHAANFSCPAHSNEPIPGQYFPPGARLLLVDYGPDFELTETDVITASKLCAAFEKALSSFTVQVDYESLYGQRFTSTWQLSK